MDKIWHLPQECLNLICDQRAVSNQMVLKPETVALGDKMHREVVPGESSEEEEDWESPV